MSSAGLYATPNIFARVIHASAEPFLGGLQSLIRRINPIVQTGPLPISTIFACSIGACMRWNLLHTPFVTVANSAVLVLSSPHLSDLRSSLLLHPITIPPHSFLFRTVISHDHYALAPMTHMLSIPTSICLPFLLCSSLFLQTILTTLKTLGRPS